EAKTFTVAMARSLSTQSSLPGNRWKRAAKVEQAIRSNIPEEGGHPFGIAVLYHRPLDPQPRGVRQPAATGAGGAARRCSHGPEVAHQPAVQQGQSAERPGALSDRLPALRGVGRPARPVEGSAAGAQWLLAE